MRWTNALSAAAHCSGRIDATASQTRARLPCRTAPLTCIKLYFSIDIIRFFADFVNCGKTKNPLLRVKIFISDFNGLRKNSRRPSKRAFDKNKLDAATKSRLYRRLFVFSGIRKKCG
ncbi:MAG: hypothetical protein DBY28_00720 [Subdoligranulum sp.]|nr:MAG: hypothetical protein DBY28_00720 [Subdoligranulum sp.]